MSDNKPLIRLLKRQVHLAMPLQVTCVSGKPGVGQHLPVLPFPCLSLCLAGKAHYHAIVDQQVTELSVTPGQGVYVQPEAGMEPVIESRYKALGVLYQPNFIRLLLVENQFGLIQKKHPRYTAVTHLPTGPDSAMEHVLDAMKLATNPIVQRSLVQTLLAMTLALMEHNESQPHIKMQGKSQVNFQAACQYLSEHLDEPIGRSDVGSFLKLHPNHISRLFQRFADQTFGQYLLQLRLERARLWLRRVDLNIAEVSKECGFGSANYFIRCYRQSYGYPPGQQKDRGIDTSASKPE